MFKFCSLFIFVKRAHPFWSYLCHAVILFSIRSHVSSRVCLQLLPPTQIDLTQVEDAPVQAATAQSPATPPPTPTSALDMVAQSPLDYLRLIVADNSQIDAITGKMVRMDTEMVKVSVDAGEGATGLVTWELAHTEEEAAQLAKATMNEYDGRIPMFHAP